MTTAVQHLMDAPDEELRHEILVWLGQHTPPPRLRHILGVEQLAHQLAEHYGLNPQQSAWAGLLHDLAKYFPAEQLLVAAAQEPGLILDPILQAEPHLLHADISAVVARDQFGVRDPAVLQAIRDHTLGRPDMPPLSCVIFVADALEPHRGDSEVLQRLRQLMMADLATCVAAVSDYGLHFLLGRNRLIHPRTIATRNAFWQQSRSNPGSITFTF